MSDDFIRKLLERMQGPPSETVLLYAAPVSCVETETGWIARKAGMAGVGATKAEAIEDVWRKLRLHLGRTPR